MISGFNLIVINIRGNLSVLFTTYNKVIRHYLPDLPLPNSASQEPELWKRFWYGNFISNLIRIQHSFTKFFCTHVHGYETFFSDTRRKPFLSCDICKWLLSFSGSIEPKNPPFYKKNWQPATEAYTPKSTQFCDS